MLFVIRCDENVGQQILIKLLQRQSQRLLIKDTRQILNKHGAVNNNLIV